MTVDLSRTLADLRPPALVDGATRLSSDDVLERAARVAGGLVDRGVRRGDVVAFQLPIGVDAVVVYLACWRLGAVAAPLHHRLSDREVDDLVTRLRPGVTIRSADDICVGSAYDGEGPNPNDLAVVLATSGSSGRPKIVQHTHGRLAYKAPLMAGVHGLHGDDVVLMPAPLAHVSGLLNGILLPGAAGMTTVLMSRWSVDEAAALIDHERVSFMIGPPTYFVQLMGAEVQAPSLRLISCGGAGVGAQFARNAATYFDAVVKRTYGSTEAPTVTTSYAGDTPECGWETDGRAVGDVELRVDDETGELFVRGSELFVGYADAADTAAAVTADGWFATGDRASLQDGWLTCHGRLGDAIIRGGENVDPAEVEQVCSSLPGVRQAVVVGYPDDEMGERVGLVVIADVAPALESVRRHCAEVGLARFKTPERVVAVDEMPILTVGKPDRAALRALLSRR